MKNFSTGTGLVALSAAILGSTIIMRFGPADQAAHAAPPIEAAKAIAAASTAQVTPTIVWYGTAGFSSNAFNVGAIFRAWSDGRVEMKRINAELSGSGTAWCTSSQICAGAWVVVSDPAQGLTYRSDINFDAKVDGADLGALLADWGNATRRDIPPSDCPLALINP
jgi:hypothetical protein